MKPSRTYNIAIFGIIGQLCVAAATVAVAIKAPESMSGAGEVLGLLAMSLGGGAAAGCGAMAARDVGSGGLTSSQGDTVLAARSSE